MTFRVLGRSHGATRRRKLCAATGAMENSLLWVLDVVFGDDQSRLRKGDGAHIMAIVRHFAINPVRPHPSSPSAASKSGARPRTMGLELRRELAGWSSDYRSTIMAPQRR